MKNERTNIRNIAVLAHVDAGKTTLTEALLFHAGAVKVAGSVNNQTAHTDTLEVERARGISVQAASAVLNHKGVQIRILDTPGHADFVGEVERSLRAVDGVILLVSLAQGIQAHTIALWQAVVALHIPTILVINKIDNTNYAIEDGLLAIQQTLSANAIPVMQLQNGVPADIFATANPYADLWAELGSLENPALLDDYVEGKAQEALRSLSVAYAQSCQAFPVFFTSGLKGVGISQLLDGIVRYLPAPVSTGEELCALVYRVVHEGTTRVAQVRMFGGTLSVRDTIALSPQEEALRITKIKTPFVNDNAELKEALPGDIVNLYGLHTAKAGDVLGNGATIPAGVQIAQPLLTLFVRPQTQQELPQLLGALTQLSAEDPHLNVSWFREQQALHLHATGPLQLQILSSLLQERYGLTAQMGAAGVIYKETPIKEAVGFTHYTMPKPCWAVIYFKVEPLPRGSGLVYQSAVHVNNIMPRYQSQMEDTIPRAAKQALYGWELTDCKITAVGGEHHLVHTHPLDFIVATPMALMNALEAAGTKLLEPYMQLHITVPAQEGAKVIGLLSNMRAEFKDSFPTGDQLTILAQAPLNDIMDFPIRLSTLTNGRAMLNLQFDSYQDCAPGFVTHLPRRSVDPRDRAKYILAARSALDGNIFS